MENVIRVIKGILLTLIIFFLYFIICPYLYSMIFRNFLESTNFWVYNLTRLGMYFFIFGIVILIIHKDIFKQFKEFIKDPKKCLNIGLTYWVYGLIIMFLANLIIQSIVGAIAVNEQTTRELLLKDPLYIIPATIFFGPFLEEIIFRFCLRKGFKKELSFALTSAIIFGGLHVTTAFDAFTLQEIINHLREFLYIIPYGALGFYFAKAYYETDNIFSSIVPHMLHNLISVVLILISSLL